MHEDDAMDLNDEGVLAMYTECCGFLRAGDQWPEGAMHSAVPHDHAPVLRLVALRAVPESDERPKLLPAENIALTVALAQIERGDRVMSNIAAALIFALERICRLSPDEAAGGE